MRVLVDIPDKQLEDLAVICENKNLPRAEVVRQAIAGYIAKNKARPTQAFGLWVEQGMDGMAYQEKVRSEW